MNEKLDAAWIKAQNSAGTLMAIDMGLQSRGYLMGALRCAQKRENARQYIESWNECLPTIREQLADSLTFHEITGDEYVKVTYELDAIDDKVQHTYMSISRRESWLSDSFMIRSHAMIAQGTENVSAIIYKILA